MFRPPKMSQRIKVGTKIYHTYSKRLKSLKMHLIQQMKITIPKAKHYYNAEIILIDTKKTIIWFDRNGNKSFTVNF